MQGAHDGQNVSSLMDGELVGDEAEREIARLKTDESLRQHWDTFHLIGDAMRGSAGGAAGFSARFSERLAQEPTVLAPRKRASHGKLQTYLLSAAASVAAVAVVGWVALSTSSTKPDAPAAVLATANGLQATPGQPVGPEALKAPPAPQVQPGEAAAPQQPTEVAAAPAPEHVQEFMLAHQGISPSTQFQGVTPYIRTVSSTGE